MVPQLLDTWLETNYKRMARVFTCTLGQPGSLSLNPKALVTWNLTGMGYEMQLDRIRVWTDWGHLIFRWDLEQRDSSIQRKRDNERSRVPAVR